ncbi:neuropeptide FF receptor 2-like [Stylophora pistillata]|uniref:neuropeptide FF receptor 2-like n=1 Tax=Stylophora pistillata TaxID=50429 RepID=UPI000C03CF9F|nr:neuropeptide FF receptor 2-like [Stylophora pistillata]
MSSYSNASESNGTEMPFPSCYTKSGPSAENIGKTLAYSLIFFVSLAGNAFIVIIVYKAKTMRKTINFFIVNMAISDLLLPVFAIPLTVTEFYTDSWLIGGAFGQATCKLVSLFEDVSTAVSVQSLILITVDRFGAVVVPLRSPLITPKLCLFSVFSTWVVAIAMFSPYLFAVKLVSVTPGKLTCTLLWNDTFGESSNPIFFFLAALAIFLYIPFSLMIILYSIILVKLKSQKPPGEHSIKVKKHFIKRQRNVLKMATAIVIGFAVCWMPVSIYNVLSLLVWDTTKLLSCNMLQYHFIASFIGRANCAVNPCICFIFSENYRQGLKNIFYFFSPHSEWNSIFRKRIEFSHPKKWFSNKSTRHSLIVDDQPSNNLVMITPV